MYRRGSYGKRVSKLKDVGTTLLSPYHPIDQRLSVLGLEKPKDGVPHQIAK